jgi:GNAT superfamily N-acetyltransferase
MSTDYAAVTEATWPSARTWRAGALTLRDGAGGGKRVSAATVDGDWSPEDLTAPLFMIRAGEDALDAALDARGYKVVDPVWVYTAPVDQISQGPLPYATAMACWPPLAIQAELWAQGGIGPERLDVMGRVAGPKTSILGRTKDQPAGTAFVACHADCAMIHAIEVAPALRRHGVARNMLWAAAHWAQSQGATELSLLVTKANAGANALYASLGMQIVGHYHYRAQDRFK